jgi:hypothetical protein
MKAHLMAVMRVVQMANQLAVN